MLICDETNCVERIPTASRGYQQRREDTNRFASMLHLHKAIELDSDERLERRLSKDWT